MIYDFTVVVNRAFQSTLPCECEWHPSTQHEEATAKKDEVRRRCLWASRNQSRNQQEKNVCKSIRQMSAEDRRKCPYLKGFRALKGVSIRKVTIGCITQKIIGKDEVGGSNPPSSSIESLEPQGVRGFLIFWIFVGKSRFPTGFPTNQVQELFYFIVAMRSLTISGFFCSSGNRACISASWEGETGEAGTVEQWKKSFSICWARCWRLSSVMWA